MWESPEETMIREVFEETGIVMQIWEAKVLFKKYFYHLETNIAIDFFYVTLESKPKVTISDEHSQYLWVTRKDALYMDLVIHFDEILNEVYNLP